MLENKHDLSNESVKKLTMFFEMDEVQFVLKQNYLFKEVAILIEQLLQQRYG